MKFQHPKHPFQSAKKQVDLEAFQKTLLKGTVKGETQKNIECQVKKCYVIFKTT